MPVNLIILEQREKGEGVDGATARWLTEAGTHVNVVALIQFIFCFLLFIVPQLKVAEMVRR